MPPSTKIAEKLHAVKLRPVGGTATVTLPAEVREQAGFFLGGGFIAIRSVGRAVMLVQVTEGTHEGIERQSNEEIDAAVRVWVHDRALANDEAKRESETNGARR